MQLIRQGSFINNTSIQCILHLNPKKGSSGMIYFSFSTDRHGEISCKGQCSLMSLCITSYSTPHPHRVYRKGSHLLLGRDMKKLNSFRMNTGFLIWNSVQTHMENTNCRRNVQHTIKIKWAGQSKPVNDSQFTGGNNHQLHQVKSILAVTASAELASQVLPMSCLQLWLHQPLKGGLWGNKGLLSS